MLNSLIHLPHSVSCPLTASPSPLLHFFSSPNVTSSGMTFGSFTCLSHHVSVKAKLTGPTMTPPPSHFMILLLFPSKSSGTVSLKEERTGSITASHGRRGWTSFIRIYTASSLAEKEGVKDEELGGRALVLVQKCLYGGFSYRYFIFTSFLMAKKEKRVALRVCVSSSP